MKNIKFLALLPLLMLSSCGLGTKLSEDQAKERIDAINEKMGNLGDDENYKNCKMSFVSESFSKDSDGEKIKVKTAYKLNANSEDEFYASVENVRGSEKTTSEIYYVKDLGDDYGDILYVKNYDSEKEEDKTTIEVMASVDDENAFNEALSGYLLSVGLISASVVTTYGNPENVAAMIDDGSDNYDVEVSYYSGINGDFSVKGVAKITSEAEESVDDDAKDSVVKSSTVMATYSKDVLSSFDSEAVYMSGDKGSTRGSLAYQKAKIKISLPSGWQNELDKEAE